MVPTYVSRTSHLLIPHARSRHKLLVAEGASLRWMFNAIATIGDAAVPLQMLILGAKLAGEDLFNLDTGLGIRTNFIIAFAKLGVMPIAGFGAAILLPRLFSSLQNMAEPFDDAMWFVIVLVTCTPTANNLVVMADLVSAEMEATIAEEQEEDGEAQQEQGPDDQGQPAAHAVAAKLITPADAVAGALKVQYLLAPFALTLSLSAALLMLSLDDAPKMVKITPQDV